MRVLGVNPTAPGFSASTSCRTPVTSSGPRAAFRPRTAPCVPSGGARVTSVRLEIEVPDGTVARAAVPTFGRDVSVTVDGRLAAGTSVRTATGSSSTGCAAASTGSRRARATSRGDGRRGDRHPGARRRRPGRDGGTAPGDLRHRAAPAGRPVEVAAPEGWTVSPREPAFDLRSDGSPAGQELRVYVVVPDDARRGSYRCASPSSPATAPARPRRARCD